MSLISGLCTQEGSIEKFWKADGFVSELRWFRGVMGNTFAIVMRSPDQRFFSTRGEFQTYQRQRLVFKVATANAARHPLLEADADVSINESAGETTLQLAVDAVALDPSAGPILNGLESGCAQGLERLADCVAELYAERDGYCDLVTTHILNAPRERVWQAWTTPKETDQWWGPWAFENYTEAMDLRPGGLWKLVMCQPNGLSSDACMTYREIDPPRRLVYQHGEPSDDDIYNFEVVVTFDDLSGATRLTIHGLFAHLDSMYSAIHEDGAENVHRQTIERLEDFLKKNYLAQR